MEGLRQESRSGFAPVAVKLAGVLIASGILWLTFRSVELERVRGLIQQIGGALVLILVPYLFAMGADTLGWRVAFANLGRKVRFWELLRIRLISEAVLMSITAGAFVSDTLTPYLLKKHGGVPVPEGLVGMAARKCLIFLADGIYVLLAVAVGFGFLAERSRDVIGVPGLPFIALGAAMLLLASSAAVALTLTRGSVAERLHHQLVRLPSARLRGVLDRAKAGFLETDRHFSRSFGFRKAQLPIATGFYLASWLLESVETWLILHLLGVDLGFGAVLSFEALLSLLRSVFFILPAGLGVQDVGYVAFLKAYGIADPITVGAAFVLLKRLKEVIWIATGYLLLLTRQERTARNSEGEERSAEDVPSASGAPL